MKACVVFCTIRKTDSFRQYARNFLEHNHSPDVIIVDEQGDTRPLIKKELEEFSVEFYGQRERQEWFKKNNVDSQTVPAKTTDVIGFSLLVAYPRKYDMLLFIDDDTYPLNNDFIGEHWKSLTSRKMPIVSSKNRWVNPHPFAYPRGYPYSVRNWMSLSNFYEKKGCQKGAVLNMGLWNKVPDLNAIDYLYFGSLKGLYEDPYHEQIPNDSYILEHDSFMPLSRMNVSFKPKVIPAFYQLTGDEYGVGRYGDVFSGLFLMKIAAHLGDNISYGVPTCLHDKEPRDVFKDIKSEMESVKLNEKMWCVLDKIELVGDSYGSCYASLADGLLKYKGEFHNPNFIVYLAERMKAWVKAIEP